MSEQRGVCPECGYDWRPGEVEWCECENGACMACCDCQQDLEDDGQPDEMTEWLDFDPDC